jgi:hypothetical protein
VDQTLNAENVTELVLVTVQLATKEIHMTRTVVAENVKLTMTVLHAWHAYNINVQTHVLVFVAYTQLVMYKIMSQFVRALKAILVIHLVSANLNQWIRYHPDKMIDRAFHLHADPTVNVVKSMVRLYARVLLVMWDHHQTVDRNVL